VKAIDLLESGNLSKLLVPRPEMNRTQNLHNGKRFLGRNRLDVTVRLLSAW